MNKPAKVFISYSEEDNELKTELDNHLSLLRREETIETWDRGKISAGSDRAESIDEELESAEVILLLLSADFMKSDRLYDGEMARALDRHDDGTAKVIPVILRPFLWEPARFAELPVVLPTNRKPIQSWRSRDEALKNVTEGITRVIEGRNLDDLPRPALPWLRRVALPVLIVSLLLATLTHLFVKNDVAQFLASGGLLTVGVLVACQEFYWWRRSGARKLTLAFACLAVLIACGLWGSWTERKRIGLEQAVLAYKHQDFAEAARLFGEQLSLRWHTDSNRKKLKEGIDASAGIQAAIEFFDAKNFPEARDSFEAERKRDWFLGEVEKTNLELARDYAELQRLLRVPPFRDLDMQSIHDNQVNNLAKKLKDKPPYPYRQPGN